MSKPKKRKKPGGPKERPRARPGGQTAQEDPVAAAAEQLAAALPQLVRVALKGAARGKPTVLRTLRGILRDLQKEARERSHQPKTMHTQLLELGELNTLEAMFCLRTVQRMRAAGIRWPPDSTAPPPDLEAPVNVVEITGETFLDPRDPMDTKPPTVSK